MLTSREGGGGGGGDVKREPATRYTMRTKRKNFVQDKYSGHLSRAGQDKYSDKTIQIQTRQIQWTSFKSRKYHLSQQEQH